MRALAITLTTVLFACGGGAGDASAGAGAAAGAAVEGDATGGQSARRAAAPAGAGSVAGETSPGAADEGPEWTFTAVHPPDPCRLLTREDASEIFGVAAKPGQSPPAGDYPCQYWSEDGEQQLVLNLSLWRDWKEHGGVRQLVEYCGGEPVAELARPGRRAVLFDNPDGGDCKVDYFWVSTGVYYQGTADSPQLERQREDGKVVSGPIAGYVHFTLSLHPTPERAVLIEQLSTAAERALARIPR